MLLYYWLLGIISSEKGLHWWNNHPWKDLKDVCKWHLGTGFHGGLGSAGGLLGLLDGSLLTWKKFPDSVIPRFHEKWAGLLVSKEERAWSPARREKKADYCTKCVLCCCVNLGWPRGPSGSRSWVLLAGLRSCTGLHFLQMQSTFWPPVKIKGSEGIGQSRF